MFYYPFNPSKYFCGKTCSQLFSERCFFFIPKYVECAKLFCRWFQAPAGAAWWRSSRCRAPTSRSPRRARSRRARATASWPSRARPRPSPTRSTSSSRRSRRRSWSARGTTPSPASCSNLGTHAHIRSSVRSSVVSSSSQTLLDHRPRYAPASSPSTIGASYLTLVKKFCFVLSDGGYNLCSSRYAPRTVSEHARLGDGTYRHIVTYLQ